MAKNLTNYLGKMLTICQSNEITSIKTPDILDVLDKLLIVQLSPIVVGLLSQAKVSLLGLFKELAKCMGENVTKFTSNNEIYYEDSDGIIKDNRPKSTPEFTMEELIAKVGFEFKIKK